MSQADELLMTLASEGTEDEHITIDSNRAITVPEVLRKIAVQYDHNMCTLTFDCPRYWDGRDLSEFSFYINYLRPNRTPGSSIAENLTVDSSDDSVLHFDWVIEKHITMYNGTLSFLVCAKKTDAEGNEENHWNSELNQQLTISAGLEFGEVVEALYPDVIEQMLKRMDEINTSISESDARVTAAVEDYFTANPITSVVFDSLLMKDSSTGKTYKLVVTDEKLTITESTS